MKKVTLLIVLMMIMAFVYAEGATVDVTGAIKGQWGMDLDNQTSGFKYVLDGIRIIVKPPVEASEVKKTGAEGDEVYGEISLNGIRLEADSDWNGIGSGYGSIPLNLKWDAFSAKLVMGPLTLMLKDGASTEINYEGAKDVAWSEAFWLTNAYDYPVFDKRYGADTDGKTAAKANAYESSNQIQFDTPGSWYSQTTNYGIVAKYSVPSVVDLGVDIASYKPWDDTTRFGTTTEDDNAYAGRVTAEVKAIENLILNVGSQFTVGYSNSGPGGPGDEIAFGGRVGYKLALGEEMSITPSVAGDISMEVAPVISVTGGIAVELPKSKITVNGGYNLSDNGFALTAAANIGLIDNLTLQGALELVDADFTAAGGDTMAIHGKLGYGIVIDEATVTPSVQVSFDNKGDATEDVPDADLNDMYLKVGVDVAGIAANTTFSINWNSNDLINTTVDGDLAGEVVFTTRISF